MQPATLTTVAGITITPDEGDLDAWTWGVGDYRKEVMQGHAETIRYMFEIIRTAGPFIGIIGFSAGATTAHTLVSLTERRASPELMQELQIDPSVCFLYISTKHKLNE